MKKLKYSILFCFTLCIGLTSCEDFETDLNVAYKENPSDETLQSDPTAIVASASGLLNNWFLTTHNYDGPGMAMATMADVFTCSWGNAGMRDLSSEPRVAFNNQSSYGNAFINETYFNALYSVLSDANAVVGSAQENPELFDEPEMITCIGKFSQALSLGYLALVYDQVWVYDETGSYNEGNSINPKEAMEFALMKLDEAIAIADANSFTLPDSWIPGETYTNTKLSKVMNSFGARMLTMNARNSSDRDATDWNRVLAYANDGVTEDFAPLADDITWYDLVKTYLIYPGWARIDLYVINMMDTNTPAYWPSGETVLPESTSADARLKTDFEYLTSQDFVAARGTYHYSSYRYSRYDDYISTWTTTMPELLKAENDLYKAEAMLRLGNLSGAASIINAGTRTTRGELPNIGASAQEIASAIHYERLVEMPLTGAGLDFFEMRKENLLQEGTLLHFPVPGAALDAIPADYYTFGGTTGVAGEDYSDTGWR
ncbi:hypothetical protein ACG2LH_02230 [Zhouia sp. PK063]|uniref:hypothetical protein n=1 Tax=Zhouia sp. PK063 TaxID=3373602 RepID=UPI0037A4D1ED